jgi:hypothetical protein
VKEGKRRFFNNFPVRKILKIKLFMRLLTLLYNFIIYIKP